MSDAGKGPPSHCCQCNISIEEASLLLICQHHLCLLCAAHSLYRCPGKVTTVRCRKCQAVTQVEEDAAAYLEKLREQSDTSVGASFASSGNGSSTTQEMVSPVVPKVIFGNQTEARPARYLESQSRLQPFPAATSTGTPLRRVLSPSPAAQMRAPRPVRFCGQCEERPADLVCEQCDEFFCRSCAASIHRRGQMAKHHLRLHLGNDNGAYSVSAPSMPSNGAVASAGRLETVESAIVEASPLRTVRITTPHISPRATTPFISPRKNEELSLQVSTPRRFESCPLHPEESLQYFCLTCECQCICAECVIHGEHRGHDVLKIREAVKQLPQRSAELLKTARLRAEELTGMVEGVKTERENVAIFVMNSRQELSRQFEMVRAGLAAEETVLMGEVQRCSSEVLELIDVGDQTSEAHVQEAYQVLRRQNAAGDAIASLNALVKLNATLKVPPPSRDASVGITELKAHLQRGFDSRLASIASLTSQIEHVGQVEREVRKPRSPIPYVSSPLSPNKGGFQEQAARSESGAYSGKAFGSLKASQNCAPTSPLHESGVASPLAPFLAGKARPTARFGSGYSPTEKQQEFMLQDPGHLENSTSRAAPRSPDKIR